MSEHGNVFMREIAEHLVEALVSRGREAELVTNELPSVGDALHNLVVAPHEFFVLFPASETDRLAAAERSVCINTEQQGTPFFDLSMNYARRGPVVLDINPWSLAAIRKLGLRGVHLPLGFVPSMDRWTLDRSRPRTVDFGLLAGRTPRREAFIGGAGGQLWEWRTDLRFFSWHRPATANTAQFTTGTDKYDTLANTRILFNVHRSDEPYFEWARVLEAVANGCVVATENSVGIEPFVSGEHLLMAHLDDLAEQAVALAFDEPRRAAMADAAHNVLTSVLHQGDLTVHALDAAKAMAVASSHRPIASALTHVPGRRHPRTAAPAPITAERQMLEKTVKDLKQAYMKQLDTIRVIERSLACVRHGSAQHTDTVSTPVVHTTVPEVSVVIPLYDQGHYLRDAIDSVVAASATLAVEVIVVDDHSTDTSLAEAHAIADELSWFPITIIAKAANGGLPAARNTGFGAARAPYVFALDADNVLYPTGLERLVEHLAAAPDDVIAAYGLLERFDENGALGLTSHLPWDVGLLVHGAYIDAMALFRRDAWTALGGYGADDGIYGWEDYDLWLRAAEHGHRASLVTAVVGRYREQPGSMRKISDIDMASNFVTLRERHPRLPWPS
ncbi:MAG: hypothetical protein RLZZ623_2627 [Actinomycetota bacterium]